MSEDYDARCRELAGKLRARLDDRLDRGSDVSEADQTRDIVHSFAARHTQALEGLQPAELHSLAGQAGIDGWAYFRHLEEGRALGHVWGVEWESEEMTNRSERRFKVVEASNKVGFEKKLNKEPGWRLHSFSVAPNPAQAGTTSQRVTIIAVLEREPTNEGGA